MTFPQNLSPSLCCSEAEMWGKQLFCHFFFFQWFSPRCFIYFEINTLWGETHYINFQTLLKILRRVRNFSFLFFFFWNVVTLQVLLVCTVQWSESDICVHIPLPSWTTFPPPPFPHPTPLSQHRAWAWAPCAISRSHYLPILYGSVYMSVPVSQLTPLFLPPLCLHLCSLHLHLYSCPAVRFLCTIFLDSMYVH